MNKFINVHTFDGKLKGLFKPYNFFTIKEKKQILVSFVSLLKNNSKRIVKTMIKDIDKPNEGNNYQPENNINSSDILCNIIKYTQDIVKIKINVIEDDVDCVDNIKLTMDIHDHKDLVKCLKEQLTDTQNLGTCNSGRVTRLLQIWLAFCCN